MIFARAARWRPLYASAVMAAAAGGGRPHALVSRRDAHASAAACNPAWCTLARPTPAEFDAIVAEADRLLTTYGDDHTTLGRQCHALGATMKARVGDVRMIEYMWRATDPEGNVGPVTGDAHLVEAVAGTGTVHIARGYDPLNPNRGMPAILQTARHEFAHLNGAREREGGVDVAEQLATACAPP